MLIRAGTLLDSKYRIIRLLGAGGMGSVWIANDELMQREVAIKFLDSRSINDPTATQRFLREAQIVGKLRSDHIITVYALGQLEDEVPYIVMELLHGETLSSRLARQRKIPTFEAIRLLDDLLDALEIAHQANIIHRDVKPDNCFIVDKSQEEHLKLIDFGISKVVEDSPSMRMTKTGVVMGTPYYMSPEQARGSRDVDHRCDIYAAGAILYECLGGKVPFSGDNINELMFKIVLESPQPLSELAPQIPVELEAVVCKAMHRDVAERFQTAKAFRQALRPFLGPRKQSGAFSAVFREEPTVVSVDRSLSERDAHVLPTQPTSTPSRSPASLSAQTPTALQAYSQVDAKRPSQAPSRSKLLWLGIVPVVTVFAVVAITQRTTPQPAVVKATVAENSVQKSQGGPSVMLSTSMGQNTTVGDGPSAQIPELKQSADAAASIPSPAGPSASASSAPAPSSVGKTKIAPTTGTKALGVRTVASSKPAASPVETATAAPAVTAVPPVVTANPVTTPPTSSAPGLRPIYDDLR